MRPYSLSHKLLSIRFFQKVYAYALIYFCCMISYLDHADTMTSATTDKYDRQLRLWGANGQRSLSETRVVLVHPTAVGTETLKNLVLPGIGSFHIIDEKTTCASAMPSNFFCVVDQTKADSLSRAAVSCEQLGELNDEVRGSFEEVPSLIEADYPYLISKQQALASSLLVVAADLPLGPLIQLARFCYKSNIPFLSVKSYGFVGTLRIATPKHTIVESKPDNTSPDLRLASFLSDKYMFPQLSELVQSTDLSTLDDAAHGHVPCVILLLKGIKEWQQQQGCSHLPNTLQEKDSFKQHIKGMSRNYNMELNFQEAFRDAYLAYTSRELPYDLQELANKASVESIESSFDVMILALRRFLNANRNEPPLEGSIPDMTSSTVLYVKLQQIYKYKADQDIQEMKKYVTQILDELTTNGNASTSVLDEDLAVFCKNVYNLNLYQTRSLDQELHLQKSDEALQIHLDNECEFVDVKDDLKMACYEPSDPPEHTPLLWYLAVRACEVFQFKHGNYPGHDARSLALQADVEEVYNILQLTLQNLDLNSADSELIQQNLVESKHIITQVVSSHNAEMHPVASVMGGVASQEAVKLITHQYVPLHHTFVYNGHASIAAVYKF